MYVQKCIKGVRGIGLAKAEDILLSEGLTCNWIRERDASGVPGVRFSEVSERLTRNNLYLHVNAYDEPHPDYLEPRRLVSQETPYISLSAGNVTAPVFSRTNTVWPAHQTALSFAIGPDGYEGECFLFYCWVIVALRPAVGVRALAEEVRDLKIYSQYTYYQGEGEIAAKIEVPASQIEKYEHWEVSGTGLNLDLKFIRERPNPSYIDPATVVNLREAL